MSLPNNIGRLLVLSVSCGLAMFMSPPSWAQIAAPSVRVAGTEVVRQESPPVAADGPVVCLFTECFGTGIPADGRQCTPSPEFVYPMVDASYVGGTIPGPFFPPDTAGGHTPSLSAPLWCAR